MNRRHFLRNPNDTLCGAGLLVALALAVSGCNRSTGQERKAQRDDAIPVTVAKVEVHSMDRTLAIVGTLLAKDEATIATQVEGQVERTLVDFGERVTKGQEIALIDTQSYEALANQSAANVLKAKASALNADQNLKRVLELQASKISSASELDSSTAAAEQTRAEVKAAEASEVVAKLNLQRSRVKAPFDGSVSERIATGGDYVKIGSPLFRIVNDRELKYIVQAPERYAALVKEGQPVQFSVDAWPGEVFEGKVNLISPAVSTQTRSFNVGARVPNTEGKLKANTFARGELVLERGVPTPMVPLESIINFAGVTKVFVIADGAARSREIKVGRVKNGYQEVVSGLQAGDLVATSGYTKLFEGAKVRLQDTQTRQPSST